MARVALFRRVPESLEELGADADATLAAVGLTRGHFEDRDRLMPYSQLEDLLLECERRTACEHFGLLLCEQSRLADLGLPGRIARCATTVGEGLTALVRNYNLHRGGGIINLIDSGRFARFVYAMAMPGTRDTRQYQMGAVAIAFNALEDLCGPDWQATELRFAFRSPANVRPFQRFFRAPVRFDSDESVVIFEREWLDRTLPPVGEAFRREVAAEARQRRERAFDDFAGLVRDIIRKQLSIGPCSIESVAAMLAVHRRTIDRRLARAGESYGALQRSVKHEIAQLLLRETNLSMQQIADSLHFSSAANFATAFRQWSGKTPSQFRAGEP
jgi:AraC-like DNA-binding protein